MIIGGVVDFFDLPTDTICAYIGHGEVAVLKASDRQSLQDWVEGPERGGVAYPSWAQLDALKEAANALLIRLRRTLHAPITIGIGRYHPRLNGLARSYEDARAALSLGKRFDGLNHVYCLDSLGVAAFVGVADESTKVDLATNMLRPLDRDPELLKTLSLFFTHNLSPGDTAAALAIHRNTLRYRLDKISSLTGLDPRRFDDAVQIRAALLLRSLGGRAQGREPVPEP